MSGIFCTFEGLPDLLRVVGYSFAQVRLCAFDPVACFHHSRRYFEGTHLPALHVHCQESDLLILSDGLAVDDFSQVSDNDA